MRAVLFSSILMLGSGASATPPRIPAADCVMLVGEAGAFAFAQENPKFRRHALLHHLTGLGVPVMLKQTRVGAIPVVLVNPVDVDDLKSFFDNTVGFSIQHQPRHATDHGMIRIGSTLMDVDSPGKRGYGEIHQTGLSWFQLASHVRHNDPLAPGNEAMVPERRIEIVYLPTAAQMKSLKYYQWSRRAAIFRVPYNFGGGRSDLGLPGTLRTFSEHCFTYSMGRGLSDQISEMESIVASRFGRAAQDLLAQPNVIRFLALAREKITDWQATYDVVADARIFDPEVALRTIIEGQQGPAQPLLSLIEPLLPNAMTNEKLAAANWLIALDSTLQYQQVMGELGYQGSYSFSEIQSQTAAAVAVYDFDRTAFGAFSNGTYSSSGRTGTWTADGQTVVQYGEVPAAE
jgi:hypothetical protein